jgi:hypothetical protein
LGTESLGSARMIAPPPPAAAAAADSPPTKRRKINNVPSEFPSLLFVYRLLLTSTAIMPTQPNTQIHDLVYLINTRSASEQSNVSEDVVHSLTNVIVQKVRQVGRSVESVEDLKTLAQVLQTL